MMKHHAAATRYKSLINRAQYLDALLEHYASQKNAGIAELLRLTVGISRRRLAEKTAAIRALLASPQGSSLECNKVYTLEQTTTAPLSKEMQYVKTLQELSFVHTLKSAGGIHLAALHPSVAADLLSKEHVAKLEKKIDQLEQKLRIIQTWTPEMDIYKVS